MRWPKLPGFFALGAIEAAAAPGLANARMTGEAGFCGKGAESFELSSWLALPESSAFAEDCTASPGASGMDSTLAGAGGAAFEHAGVAVR